MLRDENLRNLLYEYMYELLLSHGGDGTVILINDEYLRNADEFEKWLTKNRPNSLKRHNCNTHVSFCYEQADLVFCKEHLDGFGPANVININRM